MKTNNPICPFDKRECAPDIDGYIRCKECERYCNSVRETGGMSGLEMIWKLIKKIRNASEV